MANESKKRTLAAWILAAALAGAAAWTAVQPASASVRAPAGIDVRGPEVPFPLSEQVPIPWESIGGTWEGKDGGETSIYSFEPENQCAGQRALRIVQLDPATRTVLSGGYGLSDPDMQVRGVMRRRAAEDDGAHIVIVRAFRERGATEFVLTIRQLSEPEKDVRHFVLRRLSFDPVRSGNGDDGKRRECEAAAQRH